MFEFSKLCKEVENMDPATYAAIIQEKSARIIKTLGIITENGRDGMAIYMNFILCSVAADGKLDKAEFELLRSGFNALAGKEITYEEAVKMFKDAGLDKPGEYKALVDQMVDLLGLVSLDLKRDIILVCMMICAVDGKISMKERRWIKQLAR